MVPPDWVQAQHSSSPAWKDKPGGRASIFAGGGVVLDRASLRRLGLLGSEMGVHKEDGLDLPCAGLIYTVPKDMRRWPMLF